MSKALIQRTSFFSAWKSFLNTGKTKGVPVHIRDSWIRCQKLGVDPLKEVTPKLADLQLVNSKTEKNKELHQIMRSHFKKITSETDLSHFNILFFDPDGYVLAAEGHDKILQLSENSIIKVGANLSESSVGTTAPGVSLVEKRPILVHAEEHFSSMFHWATCLAIPIFDCQKKLAGCLNVSTTVENRHKLEQMVLYFYDISNSFQFEYFIKKKFEELKLYASYFDTTFKFSDKILILVNRDLEIINLNNKAKSTFSLVPLSFYGTNIANLMGLSAGRITKIFNSNNPEIVAIECGGTPKTFSVNIFPIYDTTGNEISYLLEFRHESKNIAFSAKNSAPAKFTFDRIIGNSRQMATLIYRARKAAGTSSNVLIEGDTGTGKEMLAHSIHNASSFAGGPFVPINCSAIPNELIESELFGYEKGAYTGARSTGSVGKFELANRGTIFLDEIHTMSLTAQMKILRTIEDRTVVRVGGKLPIPLEIRILAATSENINQEVEDGRFLSALFFRLNVVRLKIPSLKQRISDLPLLAKSIIREMNDKFNRNIKEIEEDALDNMMRYSWPGNVRELKNAIESAFNFCDGKIIRQDDLSIPTDLIDKEAEPLSEGQTMEDVTRQLLTDTLNRFGNVKTAAEFLEIPTSTFYRKMRKFGLSK
jgi:sigma-54 dependent transcriptional regulator, acetoin dehydrogenase operon transcriptional activator AcoR